MSDPTQLVITTGFAAALGIFAAGALVRWSVRRRTAASSLPERRAMDDEAPYRSPLPETLPPELPAGNVPVWPYIRLDLLGAGFVCGVFALLVIASLANPGGPEPALGTDALIMNIGFQFLLAGIVMVSMLCRVRLVPWLGLRWAKWPWVFLIAPGAVVFMWTVFGGLQASGYVQWMESLGAETVQDTVKLLQESRDPQVLGLMAFAAVVAAPLCEEIVFRGYLYPVAKRFAGPWLAAISSALVFACAHGNLTALLPLFIFGLVLVFIYEKTGSLWAPMAVHFCFNGATVLMQFAARYYDLPLQPAP